MLAVSLSLLVAVSGIAVWLLLDGRRHKRQAARLARDNLKLNEQLGATRARSQTLAKYEGIADADAYLAERERLARTVVDDAHALGKVLEDAARTRAGAIVTEANEKFQAAQLEGARQIAEAQGQAAAIVATADQRARERTTAELANIVEARRAADFHVTDSRLAARRMTDEAEARSNALVAQAAAHVIEQKRVADQGLAQASTEAASIIERANNRAREVAGEALDAVRNAKQAEEVARAMKNVIEGYGDSYLVPTYTVLDELGDELSFTEAGKQLKLARERLRDLIKRGQAATCDYAEPNRRETAIHFVLDAFMGKCDSVLADVRHDNFGTLQQKLRDAFSLVNKNGQAFRNARIVPSFLDSRLDELRWAVAAHELKVREREEQRVLKERLREEERAQREFEKAMKDAAKEEDTLRKAMDKARKEIERATDEQRATYEAKLAELGDRLRAAEEKNQRAKSMAQQTKQGVVYVISNIGSFGEHVYKIGMTRRYDPLERVRELGDASVPFEFDVHALIRAEDAPALERELHKRCIRHQMNKVNPRKEFFRVGLHEIRQITEMLGCETSWTMTAECREYKETLVVEQNMASKTIEESAWIAQQMKVQDSLPPEPDNDGLSLAS